MNAGRVVAGWLGLVALYTLLENADQTAGLIGWASSGLQRLASPDLGLIPNRGSSSGSTSSADAPALPYGGIRPDVNQAHPGTYTPAPYAPGKGPAAPAFPSWLTPSTGQQQSTTIRGKATPQ